MIIFVIAMLIITLGCYFIFDDLYRDYKSSGYRPDEGKAVVFKRLRICVPIACIVFTFLILFS